MVEPPTHWETKRLQLRPATVAEASDAFESYTANPQVSRYMTWRPHRIASATCSHRASGVAAS
jgi:[ribosomal protein S5]-alanine N-acetyltransferase